MSTQLKLPPLPATVSAQDPWRVMPATLTHIDTEVPGVHSYHLRLREASDRHRYRIVPGQFNMLYVPGVGEAAISVSGDPRHADPLVHTIRTVGNVTGCLSRMEVGESLGVRGPFGSCWPLEDCEGRDLLLVGGGIGLAPLRSILFDVMTRRARYGRVWLLMGARSPTDLVFHRQYPRWRQHGIEVQATVDHAQDDWQGHVGVVTDLLKRLPLEDPQATVLMTCGPEIMMRLTAQTAVELGVPAAQVHVTLERSMRCAFGLCGHCQFGPAFVCKDGPVFSYDRVAPLLEVDSL